MSKIYTREEFKKYCLRRLGWPVIDINVDDDQVSDRIDDALAFFHDYHYDGTEKLFMKHRITQEDIDRNWIYCPDAVMFVTGILPFDGSSSSVNMFDLRYQLRLHDLYDFTSVSYVSYEITMQHIRTLNLLFSGTPQFRFNRVQNKIFLDIDWSRDLKVGEYVIVECYRAMKPDLINLTGTVSIQQGNKTIIGTNTIFDQEIVENDFVNFGEYPLQVSKIISPTEAVLTYAPTFTNSSTTMSITGISDVWNNRFLKSYATAKIKMQWGNNLKKFGGIQLPGGVTLNGKEIYDEAVEEIESLEQSTYNSTSMPSEIFIG
jgi:hypothetical protein